MNETCEWRKTHKDGDRCSRSERKRNGEERKFRKKNIIVRHSKWEKHLPKKYVFRRALIFSCLVNFLIINVEVQWAKIRNDKLKKTPHWLSMVSCLCCCWMWWILRYTSMHKCTRIVYIHSISFAWAFMILNFNKANLEHEYM